MNPERKQLISLDEMGEFLGVSEETLKNWCIEEKIPHYEYNGQFFFNHVKVAKWVLDGDFNLTFCENVVAIEDKYRNYKNKGWNW